MKQDFITKHFFFLLYWQLSILQDHILDNVLLNWLGVYNIYTVIKVLNSREITSLWEKKMWWTWHIISIIAYPILKVLLFLPLVILQAIVYSLLLLFLHPRPEPRTMSLVETVSLCSGAGFLFVSCLIIWSLCYWLWNFNCTLLVFIRRCCSFAVFRTISNTYCGCWLVPNHQQWSPCY